MKQQVRHKEYLAVSLSDGTKRKTFQVHRLVAIAFLPNPNNLPQVNHKDENPSNNMVDNLEWCDNKYNCNYGNHKSNLSKAFKGRKRSEETKKKISIANSGERNGMYGKKHSEEWKAEMKRKSPWNKGIPWDEETKRKISETKRRSAS